MQVEVEHGTKSIPRSSSVGRMSMLVGSTRNATKRALGRHHALYLPIARRRHPQATLGPDTELVIEGFTRTATTFALIAFQMAQNGHVRVAHHLHAPAHVEAAVRRGVPALVTVREPRSTVLSAMVREPTVSAGQFLRSYIDFHRRLPALADGVVVATFEEVVGDFGQVTTRVNQRFGTSFAEFVHTEAAVAAVFAMIEERSRRPAWERLLGEFLAGRVSYDEYREMTAERREDAPRRAIPEANVQRPSAEREAGKAAIGARYDDPSLARLRDRAEATYLQATTFTLP